MDANEKTLAGRLFEAQREAICLEHELCTKLAVILGGGDPADSSFEDFKFCDVSYDDHDSSLELLGCNEALNLTQEQAAQIFALGFERVWLNWTDGTNRLVCKFASGIQIGERKRRGA